MTFVADRSPWSRVIAHLDCDAFFASVSLLDRPELVGKPVVVAGTGPRSVVTTASYEARRFGVHSAMSAVRARRLCPHAVFIVPDFAAYRAKSRQVWDIVRAASPTAMQHVSLDEAYLDVTAWERPRAQLRRVIETVRVNTGISLSAGLGENRVCAKTLSDFRKPKGFTQASRQECRELFAERPPGIIPGIGPKTADRLATMGIGTIGALQGTSAMTLVSVFGARAGGFLRDRAQFEDDTPVAPRPYSKSRSNELTFDTDTDDAGELEAVLHKLAADLCQELADRGRRGRTIGIKVRLDDWTNVTRARTLGESTNDPAVIIPVALALLRDYAPARPVRLLGVGVAGFDEEYAEREAQRPPKPERPRPLLKVRPQQMQLFL